ncbi:hypothetical protein B0H13DRAFT_2242339 [Mycena leptocephala]|nr:hypothetical protein B0H13DRAFT_2242339 [Mycena leptocephala]
MDNDWTFPIGQENLAAEDSEEQLPDTSSSGSETEVPLKREPYRPVKKWKERYRYNWLNEILRAEGRGDHVAHTKCVCRHPDCKSGVAEARCKDCHGCELLAKECMVREHERNPLHRVEIWNKDEAYFEQLHPDRMCSNPKRAPGKNFVVVDTYGLHEVDLYYCGCGKGQSFPVQLLRIKWLPSTGKRPRTAATFNVLRRYHLLSLESKCSMGEFYQSLARQTNNTGEPPMTRYQEFINMTRQWRNIQMLKRAGRGHETDGIATTKEGACALECPACPHPGKNLPPEWKDVPPEKKFLYALFLALDANFRMQRKDVSSEASDPDLGNGLAFFGEVNSYMAHLEKHWDQPQPKSTCVAHDARGDASSGIGTVDCARHNMKRPRGVGDLQLGERYLNMDYMFFMSLAGSGLQEFFVSYDIACQWHKNIWDRMQIYPREIRMQNETRYFVFLVPKFHLPAHIESCNVKFSFLLTRYVGQTDGEAPERGWSNINPLAMSTREMGPNLRREVLDDHFNDWNWKKILNMGIFRFYAHSEVLFGENHRTLPWETLAQWKVECVAWEADATQPNPFERKTEEISIASVRYELAEKGAAGNHPTLTQKRVMLERCSKARRKILSWMETQTQFMPEVAVLRAASAAKHARTAEPSRSLGSLCKISPFSFRRSFRGMSHACESCGLRVSSAEGQAHEALHELRHQLLVRTHAYKYKDKNILGVRDTMRSLTKIEGIDDKIKRASATYRVAHTALGILGESWTNRAGMCAAGVKPEDVRQMPEERFASQARGGRRRRRRRRGDERRSVPPVVDLAGGWISGDADRNPAMNEALRIEWAKTRSFGLRNTEEVDLEEEEMRRTPEYLRWRANWPDLLEDPRQREGHDAYATRQARMLRSIATRFERKWDGVAALIAEGERSQRTSPNTRLCLLIVNDDEEQ